MDFAKVVEERDQLYDTFEGAVRAIQQKSDFRWVPYVGRNRGFDAKKSAAAAAAAVAVQARYMYVYIAARAL